MSALLTSLPGDIPGLLRRGSPVLWDGYHGIVIACDDDMCCCAAEDGGATWTEEDMPLSSVTFDLTDPTARWQAVMWAKWESGNQGGPIWSPDEQRAFSRAIHDEMMNPTQIDALARLVLRLAGRTP